jgi:hypothetical protein
MPTWLLRFRVYGLRHRRLEHDPEKLALDPIGGVKRFPEKIMLNQVSIVAAIGARRKSFAAL